ncbi:MAG: IS1595 family transposase [Acidobacteriaceae bacterium]
MAEESSYPQSLLQATRYFADPGVCVEFVAAMRWPDGVTCPHCENKRVSYLSSRRIWKCMAKECHKQFSVKTFSIFEDSPISLDKWLVAVWLVVNCKNGISSYEIAKDLKITQKSAWFMLHRIRLALRTNDWGKGKMGSGGGAVEVDEAFVGGSPKNWHLSKRAKRVRFTPSEEKLDDHKTAVVGLLDRDTRQVRAKVIPNVKREVLQDEILKNVVGTGKVFTDGLKSYSNLPALQFVHETVDHLNEYVRGEVHTNGIENFWSLLKRGLKGTYVAVEPFHLDRYVDEQVFRFNNRATKENPMTDADRFILALSQIAGKRLTYAELTGKVGETTL